MQPPPEPQPLAEFGHEDADGWRGWIEARRSGHTQRADSSSHSGAFETVFRAGRFASTLGLSRDFLQHLEDSKVAAILHLSPNLARFLSEENPLQPELVDVLHHTPERALARAYRKWARTPSRPADIPERCAKARSLPLCKKTLEAEAEATDSLRRGADLSKSTKATSGRDSLGTTGWACPRATSRRPTRRTSCPLHARGRRRVRWA